MTTQLIPFQFESHEVRAFNIDGNPWFVGKDVCEALTIGNNRMALERLDDDEKGVSSIDTPGGNQELSIINESGLYSLILTSRKPEAKKFKKWVTSEVLPAIRKTGSYSLASSTKPTIVSQPRMYFAATRIARNLEFARSVGGRAAMYDQLRAAHQQLGLPPIMSVEMFGKPADQMPLEV